MNDPMHRYCDEDLELIINALLKIEKPTNDVLFCIERLAPQLINDYDEKEICLRILEMDYRKFFTYLSRNYHKLEKQENGTQLIVHLPVYMFRGKQVSYWDWYWAFLMPALEFKAPHNDDFIEAASEFLSNSVRLPMSDIFQLFLDKTIKKRVLHLDWHIVLAVIEKISLEDPDNSNQIISRFFTISQEYSDIRHELSPPIKKTLISSLFLSSICKLMDSRDVESFMEEFEHYILLFFEGECLDTMFRFMRSLYKNKRFILDQVKTGLLKSPLDIGKAIDFMEKVLLSRSDSLFVKIATATPPEDPQKLEAYWELVKESYLLILNIDLGLYKAVIESFSTKKGLYLKHRHLLPNDVKKPLLKSLLKAAGALLTHENKETTFINYLNTLEEVFVNDECFEMKLCYSTTLWALKNLIPSVKGETYVFAISHQKMSLKLYDHLEDILNHYCDLGRRRGTSKVPSEATLSFAAGYLTHLNEYVIFEKEIDNKHISEILELGYIKSIAELSIERTIENEKKLNLLILKIPKKWNSLFEKVILSSSSDISHGDRMNCLNYLQKSGYADTLNIYPKFLKKFSDELSRNPNLPFHSLILTANDMCRECLVQISRWESGKSARAKKKKGLYLLQTQLSFFTNIRKAVSKLITKQVSFKRTLNDDITSRKNSQCVAPSFLTPILIEEDLNLKHNKNQLDYVCLIFLKKIVPMMIMLYLDKNMQYTIHAKIAEFLNEFVNVASIELLANPIFIQTILVLQCGYNQHNIGDLYYHPIRCFFAKALETDAKYMNHVAQYLLSENESDSSLMRVGELFEGFLQMLVNYKNERMVDLSFIEPESRPIMFRFVAKFVNNVLNTFRRDFPGHEKQILKYLSVATLVLDEVVLERH